MSEKIMCGMCAEKVAVYAVSNEHGFELFACLGCVGKRAKSLKVGTNA